MKIGGMIIILGVMLLATGCISIELARRPEAKHVPVLEEEQELVTTHTVVKGETLWEIAGYPHIYGDPSKWRRIYEANKDILENPDSLKPGQVLIIPRK